MNITRFRQLALSALAVLLISGAGIAFAGNSAPAAADVEVAEPAGLDTDAVDVQEGDQTTLDSAAEAAGSEEAADIEVDGPGGNADDPADADHQFEGDE